MQIEGAIFLKWERRKDDRLEKWKKEGFEGVSKQFFQQLYLTISKERSDEERNVLYARKIYFFERF